MPVVGSLGLASQPAVVQALLSLSVHGVLTLGVHSPVVGSQGLLHSPVGQAVWLWTCTQMPCFGSLGSASQPAVVQALLSLSVHGSLTFGAGVHCAADRSLPFGVRPAARRF